MKTLKQTFKNVCDSSNMCDEQLDCSECAMNAVKLWLQQKPLKLNYLTEKETKMSEQDVNLQVALGLRSCDTLGDVCKLLDDIRVSERKKLLEELDQ